MKRYLLLLLMCLLPLQMSWAAVHCPHRGAPADGQVHAHHQAPASDSLSLAQDCPFCATAAIVIPALAFLPAHPPVVASFTPAVPARYSSPLFERPERPNW